MAILVCAGAAQAQPAAPAGSRVLIMPFSAAVDPQVRTGGTAGAALWLGEAAAVLLDQDLSARGLGALDRDERLAAFDRLQLPLSSSLTRATMIRVGELIGASEIVFGDVHLGTRLQVHARTIRLDTGRELPIVNDEDDLTNLFALFDRVARGVAAATGHTAAPVRPAPPMPLAGFENYVKGLIASTPATQQHYLETALRLAPNDPHVLMSLWNVYTTESEYAKALGAANAVAADSPLYRRARFDVALSLIDLKRYDGAFQELTTLSAAARIPAVANALGVVQLRRGAPGGSSPATTFFKRAVDAEPDNPDYLFNLGYAYALAQSPTDALSWLRESVRFDAANGDAHLVMSEVLRSTGRTAEAQRERDLAKLLGTTRDVSDAPAGKVPPDLERVVTELDDASRPRLGPIAPDRNDQQETATFHLGRARELIAAHNDRAAAAELRRAIYLTPYADEPHMLLGHIYDRAGRVSDAIDEFKVALWARESAPAHLALGQALLESGDRDGARREATRALQMSPASTDARDLLRRAGG
jgi:Tfp pilus assembly protein PilF